MSEARIPAASIPCRVARGMFSNERSVLLDLPGEERLSVLVDEKNVHVAHDPDIDEEVDGRLDVRIVADEGDSFVVDMPQPSLTQEEALYAAPDAFEVRFRVPRILDEED